MSSSPRPDAATIASSFLSKFQSRGPQIRTQLLDANQLHLLTLTLNRPDLYPSDHTHSQAQHEHKHEHQQQLHHPPKDGTPLPPGYHLVYFTPSFLESDLGADGTDTSYNPSAPFTRRMWAGGRIEWRDELRIGEHATATSTVLDVQKKGFEKGSPMVFVRQRIEYKRQPEAEVAIAEERSHVYLAGPANRRGVKQGACLCVLSRILLPPWRRFVWWGGPRAQSDSSSMSQ